MAAGQIKLGSWLLTVFTWDGLLPPCILLVPYLIEILFPNNRGAIEVMAVLLPITGYFVRLVVGKRQIASNLCGRHRLSSEPAGRPMPSRFVRHRVEKGLFPAADLGADFFDRRIGHFPERRVARMVRILLGIVAGRIVAADE